MVAQTLVDRLLAEGSKQDPIENLQENIEKGLDFRSGLPSAAAKMTQIVGTPVEDQDRVYIAVWNSAASPKVELVAKILTTSGIIATPKKTITDCGTSRAKAEYYWEVPAGVLLSLIARPGSAFTTRRGQTFIHVSLAKLPEDPDNRHTLLMQNYLETGMTLSLDSPKQSSTEGTGFIRTITGTNPAAGVELAEVVPTNARWRLRSLIATLVTSATIANRQVQLVLDNGVSFLYVTPDLLNHTAGLSITYNFGLHGPDRISVGSGTQVAHRLPDITLFQGFRVLSATNNIQVTDDWSAPVYEIEEWIEE